MKAFPESVSEINILPSHNTQPREKGREKTEGEKSRQIMSGYTCTICKRN